MAINLFGSICLSDIPKELIRTSEKNGKKYLTICINEKKQADQYGNTHYVKVYNSNKEAQTVYLGDLKATQAFYNASGTNVPQQSEKPAEPKKEENNSGLPF